ncbi:hypothetical protein ES702_01458 [subsurface metagenome]
MDINIIIIFIVIALGLMMYALHGDDDIIINMDEPYNDYLKHHQDLCPFLVECKTYENPKCHKRNHIKCNIYLEKENK